MSLMARLHIEGHSKEDTGVKIISCDYSFSQDIDARGYKTSKVRSGLINITLSGVGDTEIVQWMVSDNIKKDGKITFSGVIDTGPQRSIEFKDALLVNYHESFSDQSDILISLTISARIIIISGVTHESLWTLIDDGA